MDIIHPVSDVISPWICHFGRYNITIFGGISLANSFFTALMRYIFIVHNEKVLGYGKQNMKRIILVLNILIPTINAISTETNEYYGISHLNKCYGYDHKVFLVDNNIITTTSLDRLISTLDDSWYGRASLILLVVAKVFNGILLAVSMLNLFEGIIYYKLFSHMRR